MYSVYLEHHAPTWTPSGLGVKLSSFATLLGYNLAKAKETGDKANIVRWLANESNLGRHMEYLYSALSQIIHQFSEGKMVVDFLYSSVGDARLLAALVSENSEKNAIDWKSEFRRYVWENLATSSKVPPPEAAAEDSNSNAPFHLQKVFERSQPCLAFFPVN